jgi:hypothetical protein
VIRNFFFSMILLATAPLQAQAPSDASIRELLVLSKSQSLIETTWGTLDGHMEAGMREALKGRTLTAEQEKRLADFRSRAVGIIKEEMSWERLEPMFIDVYKATLTQAEIDGISQFYRSPAGQALINKMPQVMDHTMKLVMGRMQVVRPRLEALQKEMFDDIKATSK